MNDIWALLALMLRHYPLEDEVVLSIDKLEGLEGRYDYEDGKHRITISDSVSEDSHAEILVHEMAHAYLNSYLGPGERQIWGVVYAELYHMIFGEH